MSDTTATSRPGMEFLGEVNCSTCCRRSPRFGTARAGKFQLRCSNNNPFDPHIETEWEDFTLENVGKAITKWNELNPK